MISVSYAGQALLSGIGAKVSAIFNTTTSRFQPVGATYFLAQNVPI